MERNQKQQYRLDNGQQEQSSAKTLAGTGYQGKEEVVPGVPVIRSSTPRPISFDAMASYSGYFQSLQPGTPPLFPERAPLAPPLPEELGQSENENELDTSMAIPTSPEPTLSENMQEFLWLFEYGLEMDPAMLNGPERLEGCALLYGPAVLKGYAVMFGAQYVHGNNGPTIVAILPSIDPDAEVWGVVYRIPQHLAKRTGGQPSVLDTTHCAITPQNLFQRVEVVVHEVYRDQEIPAVTYVATDSACQELQLVSPKHWSADTQFIQRLVTIAQGHKLPQSYINHYCANQHIVLSKHGAQDVHISSQVAQHMPTIPSTHLPSSVLPPPHIRASETAPPHHDEQTTDPLPTVKEGLYAWNPFGHPLPASLQTSRALVAFSLYLTMLLLIILTFAVLHGLGFGHHVLANTFAPLGVPWLVIVYGLLGGCVSCLLTLRQLRIPHPPLFVVITWFTRPYIGAVLAIFAYLLLTSGLFIGGQSVQRHTAFFWLVGALAGFSEGWIFFRRG